MIFHLLIKGKMVKKKSKKNLALKLLAVVNIILMNVEMPTIVGKLWHFNSFEQDKFLI